jgi:hypothetical protein
VEISKAQRNEIAEAIQASGFSPADFEPDESDAAISVRHKPTGSELLVNFGEMGYLFAVSWTVGDDPMKGRSADELRFVTQDWLNDLATYLATPNLWEEIGKEPLADLIEDQENTRFSTGEQAQIATVVAEVLTNAKTDFGLDEPQIKVLEAKLDYLVEAAGHTRRIDWLNLALGIFADRAASAALTPEVVHKVLGALDVGLGALFGHAPMLGR